jgi:hypothetical protein
MIARRRIAGVDVNGSREAPQGETWLLLNEYHVVGEDREGGLGRGERKRAFSRTARAREYDCQIADHERGCVHWSPAAAGQQEQQQCIENIGKVSRIFQQGGRDGRIGLSRGRVRGPFCASSFRAQP